MPCNKRLLAAAALGAALATGSTAALAEDFPTGPITLIVGASAGGTTDALARVVAQGLNERYGVPAVVENMPGAGANIAAGEVKAAEPDGHRLLVAFTSHTLNASLFEELPHDPIEDFTPIALLAQTSSILVSRGDLDFEDMDALLEHARTQPGGVTFAVGGLGSSLHMETLKFISEAEVDGVVIPYPGTAPAITDLLGGHVDFMFAPFAAAVPLIEAGDVNAHAVTSPERNPNFPDLIALPEVLDGYPITYAWFGVLGPADMDAEVVQELNTAIVEIMQGESAMALLRNEGAQPVDKGPDEFAAFLEEDLAGWQTIAEEAEIERQ